MKHVLLTIIFLLLIPSGISRAEEIIVPTDDYPPWKIAKDDKITGGIDNQIISALFKGLDITPRHILAPWKRCLSMMEQGQGDLISGITKNTERVRYLTYLNPPYKTKSQKVLYVRRGIGSSFQNLTDLENKQIGIIRGGKYFPAFDQNPAIIKNELNSDLQGMKMLSKGRIDGFLITKENGEYLLQNYPQMKEELEMAIWRYDKVVEVYLAISSKSILIPRKKELETRLQQLVDSGEVEAIIDNFFQ